MTEFLLISWKKKEFQNVWGEFGGWVLFLTSKSRPALWILSQNKMIIPNEVTLYYANNALQSMISEFSKTEVYYRTHEAHVQSLTKLDLDVNV